MKNIHTCKHEKIKLKHIKENGTFDYDREAIAAAPHCCWLATSYISFSINFVIAIEQISNKSITFHRYGLLRCNLFSILTDPISTKFLELVKLKRYALHFGWIIVSQPMKMTLC